MKGIPPQVLLVFATILWGGNFVIGRAVANDVPPLTLSFLRWCTAFVVFFPFAWPYIKKEWSQIKQHWIIVVCMALTGVAGFNTLVYIALHYTTSISASLVNTSTPIIIYMLSFLFFRERLNKNQWIGTVLSIGGVLFILSEGSLTKLAAFLFNIGDMIVVIAVICWSVYSILLKKYAAMLPSISTFLTTIAIGTMMLLPFFLYETFYLTSEINWSVQSIFSILYIGIFASIVAFLAWNTGVVQLGANRAGIFLNLIPVFAATFAIIFIGEKLAFYQIIGGILVIAGVYLSNKMNIKLSKKSVKDKQVRSKI